MQSWVGLVTRFELHGDAAARSKKYVNPCTLFEIITYILIYGPGVFFKRLLLGREPLT